MFADSLSVRLEAGSLVQFLYPRHNFMCVQNPQIELRRVRVDRVVDFREEAPDGSYPMEPHLRRGKLLVVGYDLDKHATRRFYVESMSELRALDLSPRELPPLRTAIVQDGRLIDLEQRPDPRESFCRHFNQQAEGFGMTAVA